MYKLFCGLFSSKLSQKFRKIVFVAIFTDFFDYEQFTECCNYILLLVCSAVSTFQDLINLRQLNPYVQYIHICHNNCTISLFLRESEQFSRNFFRNVFSTKYMQQKKMTANQLKHARKVQQCKKVKGNFSTEILTRVLSRKNYLLLDYFCSYVSPAKFEAQLLRSTKKIRLIGSIVLVRWLVAMSISIEHEGELTSVGFAMLGFVKEDFGFWFLEDSDARIN